MGFLGSLIRGENLAPAVDKVGPAFSTSIDPGTLYGVGSLDEAMALMASVQKITRAQAMTVPAVIGARNRICALGQLPLQLHEPDGTVVADWDFMTNPERGTTGSQTWTNALDDLLFSGRCFIKITHTNGYGFPAEGVRLLPETVTVQPQYVTHQTATTSGLSLEYPEDPHLIRIDSPKDPLLVSGARAIRTLLRLEAGALNAVDGVPMTDYFEPAEGGVNPFADDDEAQEFLDAWAAARRKRSTGYVPVSLKYNTNNITPEQLQLVESREMAIAEIARLTGLDGEDLNVPTTSRTYFNAQDRRRNFLDFVGGPFPRAIEDRLSQDDVTPQGHYVRFDLNAFMQADDYTLAQTDVLLAGGPVLSRDEVRGRRNLAPLPTATETETPADV